MDDILNRSKGQGSLKNNHLTNSPHFDEINNCTKALYPLALEAIYATINSCNHQLKNMSKTSSSWEFQSTTKAQELITRWRPSPTEIFFRAVERGNLEEVQITPAQTIQIQKNFDSAREAMSRMAKRVYENIIGSERGEELLSKAEEYNIPYEADCVNWLKLINEVETYEGLLSEADEYNIAWDLSEYDPVGLQQEIEYCVSASRSKTNDLHRYYLDTRF